MKKVFKSIMALGVTGVASVATSPFAMALDKRTTLDKLGSDTISTKENIVNVVLDVMVWVLGIAFSIAVAMIIVGGFRYVASAGNEGLAESAKETITKAVIGLIIVLLAYVIASTIDSVLLGRGIAGAQ